MIIEIILFFLLGCLLGVLAGLVPGLHPNTLLFIMFSLFWSIDYQFDLSIISFIVAMSVTNTVVNFIPSIFLGAPEPDSCLSVLPGHRMLLKGMGYQALLFTVVGGIGVMIITTIAFPFVLWFIPFIYSNIHPYIHLLLIGLVSLLLYFEKGTKRILSLFIFSFSGIAGFLVLTSLSSQYALFPSLTGLFGLSTIIMSIFHASCLPKQRMIIKKNVKWFRGSLAGWIAGMFVGILPGIGSAQAGVLASKFTKGNDKDFLVSLGGINTSNMVFTFISLHAIGKTRSGAAFTVSEIVGKISLGEVCFILLIALLSCFLSSLITLKLGKVAIRRIDKVNYKKLNKFVLSVLLLLIVVFSGIGGIVISLLCAVIGLISVKLGVKRMYLMGFLIIPTIIYFTKLSLSGV